MFDCSKSEQNVNVFSVHAKARKMGRVNNG